jgi:hypothetical protein
MSTQRMTGGRARPGISAGAGGAVKEKGRDDGCCGIDFLKYVLFIFNFIFWLSGLGIVAIGVWTLWDRNHYVSLLTSTTYAATTYVLLGTGGAILLVGFIGCCGAWRENRLCLMTYACFLLVIFLLEAVAGILAYMYEAAVHDELVRSLNQTMLQNYMIDKEKTLAIDHMQQNFKCCGAGSFRDWKHSRWLMGNPAINNTVPDSCCKTVTPGCAIRSHPSNIYYDGCVPELEVYLKEHLIILGAVGLGICCLQIFGIVFACCLAKRIKEWADRQAALAWIG